MAFNNRILNLLWYGTLAGPLVISAGFLAFDLQIGVTWIPSWLLWSGALVVMLLDLAGSRALVCRLLAPERVAARPVPPGMLAGEGTGALALAKVQVVSMLAAAILNAPPMVLTLLALVHDEKRLALVVGVLGLAVAWLAKPDFPAQIHAAQRRLEAARCPACAR